MPIARIDDSCNTSRSVGLTSLLVGDLQRTIPACGGIPPLAAVCCEGGEEAQLHAVATLHNSTSSTPQPQHWHPMPIIAAATDTVCASQ
eukprot:scaffold4170_cov330-Prasinococcus_capsulatus_cf.AAC.4